MTAADPAIGRRKEPGPSIAGIGERYGSDLHDTQVAAVLGIALGVTFATCFATGVLSHLIQQPPGWFTWPSRPAGLYRVTQGLHVASGLASIPLLVAKIWVVAPTFWTWPPVKGVAHAVERVMLLPLVAGGAFMLVSGTINTFQWYPWEFSFTKAHYWVAWITIGGLVGHIGAKATVTWASVRETRSPGDGAAPTHYEGGSRVDGAAPTQDEAGSRRSGTSARAAGARSEAGSEKGSERAVGRDDARGDDPGGRDLGGDLVGRAGAADRRWFLGGVAAASGAITLATLGQTVRPLRAVSVLAPRDPAAGPQGLPVNKTAEGASITPELVDDSYRLRVTGRVSRPLELTLADLAAMPQRSATLAIACVEGWSASANWRGIVLRDLLELAGADPGAELGIASLQTGGLYRTSTVSATHAADRDTLLALELDGEPLALDHGYPLRLIGPNRPGVMQTKWVNEIEVR